MNSYDDSRILENLITDNLSIESQIEALFTVAKNVLDKGAFRARTIRFKLDKYLKSTDPCDRIFALNNILAEGKDLEIVPKEEDLQDAIDRTVDLISNELAKRYIQNKIEAEVEQSIMEKQEKYIDEVRLSVINKQKGVENKKTLSKLDNLVDLDSRVTSKNIMSFLRPSKFEEVVGQERAVKDNNSKYKSYSKWSATLPGHREYKFQHAIISSVNEEVTNVCSNIYSLKDAVDRSYDSYIRDTRTLARDLKTLKKYTPDGLDHKITKIISKIESRITATEKRKRELSSYINEVVLKYLIENSNDESSVTATSEDAGFNDTGSQTIDV